MMLRLVIAILAIALSFSFTVSSWAQGQIHFNNRVPPDIDAMRHSCAQTVYRVPHPDTSHNFLPAHPELLFPH